MGDEVVEKDYYAELELTKSATKDEIGKSFRRLAAKYHPDRHPGDKAAEEKFKRVAEAYQVLSDPKSREAYDRGGEEQVRVDTGFKGFGTTEDILSHFAAMFRGGGFQRGPRGAWSESFELEPDFAEADIGPADTDYLTKVDVFTALLGGMLDLQLDGSRVEMRIPAGTQPGQLFRLRGQGRPDRRGRRGDALIRVEVEIPRTLSPAQRRHLEQARLP